MSKRPFPYDDATHEECIAKRARLVEKLKAVTTRLKAFEPPEQEGPACKRCAGTTTLRTSNSEKNPGRKYWSCATDGFSEWVKSDAAPSGPIVGQCKTCKHARKFGVKGEPVDERVRAAINDGTYECETCVSDSAF